MNNDDKVLKFFRNYKDRGMVKWAGFYLSDHVQKMDKKRKYDSIIEIKKSEMSTEEISKVLMKAFAEFKEVTIQLSILNDQGELLRSIKGHVLGVDGESVAIDDYVVKLSEINHVEIIKKGR